MKKKARILWLSRDKRAGYLNYELWKNQPQMGGRRREMAGRYYDGCMILVLSPANWAIFSDLRIHKGQCVEVVLKHGFKLERAG